MTTNDLEQDLPRILYILGTARSGSTILEILLASDPKAFGAGEITFLPKDGLVRDRECSCHHPVSTCEVWGRVLKQLVLANGALKSWVSLQHKVDWHLGFFRQLLSCIPIKHFHEYELYNKNLFVAIKQATNCSVVIDSSKYAGRALAVNRIMGRNMSVICLTRSPDGLMNSFKKPNKEEQRPKTPLKTLVYYVLTLTSLRITCAKLGKCVHQLRYEELISNPVGSLEKIESWRGFDLSIAKQHVKNKRPLDVGHIVTGNRLRKNGQVVFKSSKDEYFVGRWEKFVIGIMQVWKWILRF